MKEFFHYNPYRHKRRIRFVLSVTLLPLFLFSAIAVLVIIVNMRTYHAAGLLIPTVQFVVAAAVFGMLLSWVLIDSDMRKNRNNARYSYVHLGLKEIVFSKYAGAYIKDGKRIVVREVSIIPLDGLSKLGINEKNGRIYISCEKKPVRRYIDRDSRLIYRFKEGAAVFENWWYNENCSDETDSVMIPPLFGGAGALCDSIVSAKKRFDEIPPKKKYIHKEPDFIKRRKAIQALKKLNERYYD